MTTDIRKGDLVKATSRTDPENSATFRVTAAGKFYVESVHNLFFQIDKHAFEVLDRPLPPIDEELLAGATKAYGMARNLVYPDLTRDGIKAVINFVREYDKNATKENSK